MKKIILFASFFCILSSLYSQSPMWVEYQYNTVNYPETKTGFHTHTLQGFYLGKPLKKNSKFSINSFALASKGWGEILLLPTYTKQTKAGLISTSLGLGIETATVAPRIGASVFYLNKKWEGLLFFEQGTNTTKNQWYLSYVKYKIVQHDNGPFASVGLHAQKGSIYGIRGEIGSTGEFLVWLVFGKANFNKKNKAVLLGLRYYI